MLFPKKVESINTSLSIPQYCSINYLSILPSLQSVLQYCQPSAYKHRWCETSSNEAPPAFYLGLGLGTEAVARGD